MTLNEYQTEQKKTAQDHKRVNSPDLRAIIAVLGLVGEAGELANVVKKLAVRGDIAVTLEVIAEEAGDVLWYLTELCSTYGLTLDEVARKNVSKLRIRYGGEHALPVRSQ